MKFNSVPNPDNKEYLTNSNIGYNYEGDIYKPEKQLQIAAKMEKESRLYDPIQAEKEREQDNSPQKKRYLKW